MRDPYDLAFLLLCQSVEDRHQLPADVPEDRLPPLVEPVACSLSQFGLRLTKAVGPVSYLVVDHVEPPTEK